MDTSRSFTHLARSAALAIGATLAASAPGAYAHDHGHRITPPAVPASIQVEAGNRVFRVGHATGTQNYVCLPSGTGFAWSLFTPQATLFNDGDKQIITHFFGPNPDERGTIRAAWQDSKDTSTVWAQADAPPLTDPAVVAQGAVAWLRLKTAGVEPGPRGGDELTRVTFIQRVNTQGGVAPSSGCSEAANVGARQFVPYTADYFFYESDNGNEE